MTFLEIFFREILYLVYHGLQALLVRRTLPELPAGEVIEVSQGGHSRLGVSHDHDLTSLGSVGPDDGHLGVLPDVAGGLPPLSEEEDAVSLQRSVRGAGEVKVALADLNIEK